MQYNILFLSADHPKPKILTITFIKFVLVRFG